MKFRLCGSGAFQQVERRHHRRGDPLVITVSGLPALIVSTVCARQGTPTFFWIRSINCRAVRPGCWASQGTQCE